MREELFQEITDEMYKIYKMTNEDYGSSVSDTYKDFGIVSFLVRIQDKVNRLKTLTKKESLVKDEKIEDTLLDLANYSILALIELKMEANNERS